MSLQVWMEENSLDPPKLSSKQKVEKLVKALIKEREWVMKELQKEVENIGSTTLHTLQQIQLALEDGDNPLWGSYGPMQGTGQYVERSNSHAARFHQINETLDAIYSLFPELKPATKPRNLKRRAKRREPTTPNPVDPETKPKKKARKT